MTTRCCQATPALLLAAQGSVTGLAAQCSLSFRFHRTLPGHTCSSSSRTRIHNRPSSPMLSLFRFHTTLQGHTCSSSSHTRIHNRPSSPMLSRFHFYTRRCQATPAVLLAAQGSTTGLAAQCSLFFVSTGRCQGHTCSSPSRTRIHNRPSSPMLSLFRFHKTLPGHTCFSSSRTRIHNRPSSPMLSHFRFHNTLPSHTCFSSSRTRIRNGPSSPMLSVFRFHKTLPGHTCSSSSRTRIHNRPSSPMLSLFRFHKTLPGHTCSSSSHTRILAAQRPTLSFFSFPQDVARPQLLFF